jgi:replication factor A2
MLLDAKTEASGDFSHDGTPLTQVRHLGPYDTRGVANKSKIMFVGQVQNMSIQSTHVSYRIDDGTGIFDVKKFIDSDARDDLDASGMAMKLPQQDQYVKVFGTLKEFNSKRHVAAVFVRPISDFNEIPHHLLEATLVHLQLTRGSPNGAAGGADNGANQMSNQGGGYDQQVNQRLFKMSQASQKVYQFLSNTAYGNEGCNKAEIARGLNMELNACHRAGTELIDAGLLFTTMDDDTWAIMVTD